MISMLQIHPTLECNRHCSFCSYRDDIDTDALSFSVISNHLRQAALLGCKALKVSGGGEPLLYPDIVSLFRRAKNFNLKIYLQTNGMLLNDIHRSLCDDIRVSYGDGISFDEEKENIKPDGYSYIVTSKPDYVNLKHLMEYAIQHSLYVRVALDDTSVDVPRPEEILHHIPSLRLHKGATTIPITHKYTLWDNNHFHQGRNPCSSSIKTPLLGADGYWYPCCRTQFALEHKVWRYNRKMRMGMGTLPLKPYDGSSCTNCSYK